MTDVAEWVAIAFRHTRTNIDIIRSILCGNGNFPSMLTEQSCFVVKFFKNDILVLPHRQGKDFKAILPNTVGKKHEKFEFDHRWHGNERSLVTPADKC